MAEAKKTKTKAKTATLDDIDNQGRTMPQAIEFEEALLGSMMLEQNATGQIIDSLLPEMFYKEQNRIIFVAMQQIYRTQNPVDLLSVTEQLRRNKELTQIGGQYYLAMLTEKVVSSANIEYYARIIKEKYIQRQLISISTQTIHDAFDDQDAFYLLDEAEKGLYEIQEKNFTRNSVEMSVLVKKFIDELAIARQQGEEIRGVPSGFTGLDKLTNGWQRSNLIIIAARPGMGKTAFVLSMARNMAVDKKRPVAIFSLEMSANDLVTRLASSELTIAQDSLRKAKLTDQQWEKVINGMEALAEAPLYIDDTPGLTLFALRAKCRRLKQQHKIQCIIIDYLQLMNSDNSGRQTNREQEISTISRSLKGLAKELDIPVIALSQLNRGVESRTAASKRPQLSDLRESGAIEQDADMVLFIYRPEYYKIETFEDGQASAGLADIIIAKHRNGALDDVRLRFIKEQAKFTDIPLDTLQSMTLPSKINEPTDEINDDNVPF